MTWDEFIAELANRSISQREFARRNDMDVSIVNRWKGRKKGIPKWVPLWFKTKPVRSDRKLPHA